MSVAEPKIDVLEDLRERFCEESRRELNVIESFTTGGLSRDKARETVHRWIGSAALLGYFDLSELATRLEKRILAGCDPSGESVRRLIDSIGRELDDAWEGTAGEAESGEADDPSELSTSRVGLMGFGGSDSDRLCRAFALSGASCLRCEAKAGPEALSAFDLLVVRLDSRGAEGDGALAALETTAARLWIGDDAETSSRLTRHAGPPADFLIEPFRDDELIIRAAVLLRRQPENPAPLAVEGEGKPHVVLADDDAIVTAILEATLVEHGFICSTARNGEETIEVCLREKPDAVVLDVVMPGLNGFEVIERLRADRLMQSTPVVLLTSRRQESDVLRGFRLGADDYVVKPFRPAEVLARLRRLIGVDRASAGA